MKIQNILAFVFLICIFCPTLVMADKITIVADVWCPYNCDATSSTPGYMIEIAEKIFNNAGHMIVYSNMDWKKAVEETRKGKYTAIVGANRGDSPDFIFPDRSQGASQNIFFVKRGTAWKYTGIDSLKKVKLGVAQGYSYSDELDKYISANKGKPSIYVSKGDMPLQDQIDKLLKSQIDVFIEDPSVYGNYIGSNGLLKVLGAIQDAGSGGAAQKIYIAFSPANPKSKEYAVVLSKGIDQLRKSGELKKILAKYFVKDWE